VGTQTRVCRVQRPIMENVMCTVYLCNPVTLLVLQVFLVIHYATTVINYLQI